MELNSMGLLGLISILSKICSGPSACLPKHPAYQRKLEELFKLNSVKSYLVYYSSSDPHSI